MLKDIGENIDSCGNVGVERLSIVDRVFALIGSAIMAGRRYFDEAHRSISVEMTTHIFDL